MASFMSTTSPFVKFYQDDALVLKRCFGGNAAMEEIFRQLSSFGG